MHFRGVRVTPGTELNDPGAVFLPIFFRPFFHVIVAEIRGRIATVTSGAGNAPSEMNVLYDRL